MADPSFHARGRILPSEEETDVFIVDGRFTFHKPPRAETIAKGGFLLPGLVDAHAHLSLNSPMGRGTPEQRVRASAQAHLDAGVLLVREPGSPERAGAGIKEGEGLPHVQTGGRFLSPPGGYFPGLAREIDPKLVAAAVTEEAKASGFWVKLVGDFVGKDGRLKVNWAGEQLKAAAKAAHAAGTKIAIHSVHPDTVTGAIEAGFDSIEHGHAMRPEQVEAMRKKKVAWCPTMMIAPMVPQVLGGMLSSQGRQELETWSGTLPKMVATASEAGVAMLAGSDAALTPHGAIWQEVGWFIKSGVAPERALAAASWDARAYLGHRSIEEGAPADLVVFEKDPRKSADNLRKPTAIFLGGKPARHSGP